MDKFKGYLYSLAVDKRRGFIPGIIKILLWGFSLIYGLILGGLFLFCRLFRKRLPVKALSVGNITLGGTGKTTIVEFIARYLADKGHKVAILSRGYKTGDEPAMLAKNLGNIPVIVDANRVRGAKKAARDYCADTVILDDGFQQWKIKKDLEIVAIDAVNPFGNRRIIPRGILREPISSLKRAGVFFITKANLVISTQKLNDTLSKINPGALIVESAHQPLGFYRLGLPQELFGPDIFQEKAVTLFSGIGDPASFESLIKSLNMDIGLSFRFPDHYQYRPPDLERIISLSEQKKIGAIITTEKDAARIRQLPITDQRLPIFILRISIKIIVNEGLFYDRLLGLYLS